MIGQCQWINGKLILINSDGTNPRVLLEEDARYSGLDWSPDGTKMYSTIPCGDNYAKLGILDVVNDFHRSWLAEFPGWEQNACGGGPYIDHCSWSPDGQIILFDLVFHEGYYEGPVSGGQIYQITSDGSQVEKFMPGVAPDWSPDGQRSVYQGNEDQWGTESSTDRPAIVVADADGSDPFQVGWGFDPSWGP